jgi:diguanylate cyclase (GGDEF)-like protein
MPAEIRSLGTPEPHQDLLHSAYFIEQICLLLAFQIIVINLLSRVLSPIEVLLPSALLHMRVSSACAGLCATFALFLTEDGRSVRLRRTGQILSLCCVVVAAVALRTIADQAPYHPEFSHASLFATPVAFLLLGTAIFLIRSRGLLARHIADALAACLAFLVLVLFSELVFGVAHIPGSSVTGPTRIPTLACLLLLTLAVIIRRAEHGIFSVFLQSGMDGRIARILAPILFALPLAREICRALLLNAQFVPAHYATAVLTSAMIATSFALLLILTRYIRRMEVGIHELNLRDELTGLYNFRGFNILAEQAYRLAQRSGLPFGVLFVDMDNLKTINDQLGHSAGSVCLVETAKLLNATFRETDVIGRLGGDEFVVAGQFDTLEISTAIERLRAAAAAKTNIAGKNATLSLSIGYASSALASSENLKSVVARADKAMYKEKREKKRGLEQVTV